MTDRPIIFSAPMVRALLEGRKTQTRRLATSPLRRCEPGDRLYVREAWRTHRVSDELPPRLLTGEGRVWFEADRDNCDQHGRLRPGMHMPRWASRLTLIVEAVRVETLGVITSADAQAEGLTSLSKDGGRTNKWGIPDKDGLPGTDDHGWPWPAWHVDPVCAYWNLWDRLHTAPGETSEANPNVLVLTFRVERCNIDRLAA